MFDVVGCGRAFPRLATAALASALVPGVSLAVVTPGAPTPAPASVNGSLTVSGQTVTINGAETKYDNVSLLEYGAISASLGTDPRAEVGFNSPYGGTGYVDVRYHVIYADPDFGAPHPGGGGPTVMATLTALDSLSATGGTASDYLYVQGQYFDYPYYVNHCVSDIGGCGGGNGTPVTSKMITMVVNEDYEVYLHVAVSGDEANAMLDPTFQAAPGSPAGGRFVYSPSVGSVPEPAAWTLMLIGMAGVGALARRRGGATVTA